MTIKIEINAHPDRGDMRDQIEQAMSALGFRRDHHGEPSVGVANPVPARPSVDADHVEDGARPFTEDEVIAEKKKFVGTASQMMVREAAAAAKPEETTEQPVRERGKPAPGRKRRTKEEIAEDEAFEKRWDENEAKQDAEQAVISTGEERISPEDAPEETAEDAADEAAEAAAGKSDVLTTDDLRQAAGRYRAAFGNQALFADLPALIGGALVEVPGDKIADAIAKIDAAIANAPTEDNEPAPVEAPTATKDEVVAAMMEYLRFADGPEAKPNDASTFPKSDEDFGKLFTMLFGAGITKLSHVPAKPEAYGKVLAGLQEMLAKDPFGRKA